MSKRAAAVAETRSRIVDATRELHTEQGIAATSWDDIATRAGVGVGTVYRHFPTLDDLVPACGERSSEIVALPSTDEIEAIFARLATPAERVATLVEEAYAIYERGAREIRVARREPEAHASVAAFDAALETTLHALLDAAGIDPSDRPVIRAMIDLDTWDALRSAGLTARAAVAAMTEMLTAWQR